MTVDGAEGETCCASCGRAECDDIKLKICTACRLVRYCSVACQKDHRKQHKKACKKRAAESLVTCQTLTGKGRALIATAALTLGCHPFKSVKNISDKEEKIREKDGLCAPLVQPTLIESMRASRCSYCFQLIASSERLGRSSSSSFPLLHNHCSTECRGLDKFWQNEQHASMKLVMSGRTSSVPSPTVLTCCRILQSSLTNPKVLTEYNQLCYKEDKDDDDSKKKSEQGAVHLKIITQCHQLLLAMGDTSAAKLAHDLLDPNPILALQFISRLTMNGFTICNAEQEALGVGVYPKASMINHSCRPNAVQTFWLSGSSDRNHHPPMLQITMCRNAKVGEEVTISYCDVSPPRYHRRKGLKSNYNFFCNCPLCQDIERDDVLIGLRCTSQKCEGTVRSSSTYDDDMPCGADEMKEKRQYYCDTCGHSEFDQSLKAISKLKTRVEAIDSKLKDDSVHDNIKYSKEVGEELKQLYDSMSTYCNPQTSWYMSWICDIFVHWCANALSHLLKEEEQLRTCHEALSVLNRSRMATKFCYDYEGSLAWLIKKGMEAKLRLFVNPMDLEALVNLRDVKSDLMRYYPSSDEILLSLDESIRAYSYS